MNLRLTWPAIVLALALSGYAQQIKLLTQAHDPYGFPRPGADQKNVALRTSFYIELGLEKADKADFIPSESIAIRLRPAGAKPFDLLQTGRHFAAGYSGKFIPKNDKGLAIYITSNAALKPATTYTIELSATSQKGLKLPTKAGSWSFTTEPAPLQHDLSAAIDLNAPAVRWHGAFFSGFCKPFFCTSDPVMLETYELMQKAYRQSSKAWDLQRDFWLTGVDRKPEWLAQQQPGIVRERETRRIAAMEDRPQGTLLRVEDFFGHQQYGIASHRPLSQDYRPGDEVLIADTSHDARAKVLATDDQASTVLVSKLATPAGGWQIAYAGELPKQEDPKAPGFFPPGGCHLMKFKPCGTPCYYWGRLDKEWDIAQRQFGHRLMPNFADAPGDLAIDGRNWTTAKDYVELHEVVRAITSHLIERYGEASLDFVWSIFNEPDLGGLFWRTDWNELQKFYDYSTDAVLRAFEDHGYDSQRVFIGGLELGAIFGTNMRIEDFLVHCSPRAKSKDALPKNAAFADSRLDGKRSKRVEALCRASGGKGAPCDFVSVHAYNRSETMAAKLVHAKQVALKIDPEYYARLWVNSHEACPNWLPPPDPAAADSYLGNGYFPTWCADVARRQLQAAFKDSRYAFGETILTFWMGPNENFSSLNNCTRLINLDENGDGKTDRKVLVPMPIFNFLGLLASMGDDYWVLPEQTCGGHVISGFATRAKDDLRVLFYAHDAQDTQSRSDRTFKVALDLSGLPWQRVKVQEYRLDRENNSYYELGQQLRDRPPGRTGKTATAPAVPLDQAAQVLESGKPDAQLAMLEKLSAMGPAAQPAVGAVFRLAGETKDETIRAAATRTLKAIGGGEVCFTPDEVRRIQTLATLHTTASSTHAVQAGRLKLTAELHGNGVNFLIISP